MKLITNFLSNIRLLTPTTATAAAIMSEKIPLVLICCGSFNPVTNMHLRMFELAKDYLESKGKYNVVSGILSPVSDAYKKRGLIESRYRCDMIRLALANNDFLRLSTWESDNSNWTPTLEVLDYHKNKLQETYGSNLQLMLISGGDLVETFVIPNVWKDEHIEEILSKYGLAVINRHGSNPEKIIYQTDLLYKYRHNINLITDWITNDISSTKIRRAISRKESVKYLINDLVIDYIEKNKLYAASS